VGSIAVRVVRWLDSHTVTADPLAIAFNGQTSKILAPTWRTYNVWLEPAWRLVTSPQQVS